MPSYEIVKQALMSFGRHDLIKVAKNAELRDNVVGLASTAQLAQLFPLGVALYVYEFAHERLQRDMLRLPRSSSSATNNVDHGSVRSGGGRGGGGGGGLAMSESASVGSVTSGGIGGGSSSLEELVDMWQEDEDGFEIEVVDSDDDDGKLPQVWTTKGGELRVVRVNGPAMRLFGVSDPAAFPEKWGDLLPPGYRFGVKAMAKDLCGPKGTYGPVRIELSTQPSAAAAAAAKDKDDDNENDDDDDDSAAFAVFAEHSAMAMGSVAVHLLVPHTVPLSAGGAVLMGTVGPGEDVLRGWQTTRLVIDVFHVAESPMDAVAPALEIVSRWLGLDLGILSHVVDEVYTVEENWDASGQCANGTTFDLSNTYCANVLHCPEAVDVLAVPVWSNTEMATQPCAALFGLDSYIGAPVVSHGEVYGTINFSDVRSRGPFSESEIHVVKLLAMLVGRALDDRAVLTAIKELAQLNATLDAKVTSRTAELQAMMETARSASLAKSHFLGVVSHEIRTPLHAVSAMMEFLSASRLDSKQADFVRVAEGQLDSLKTLVESILTFTRSESELSGSIQADAMFRPHELVADVLGAMSSRARDEAVELTVEADSSLGQDVVLSVPHTMVQRMCFNLVENSIKYARADASPRPYVHVLVTYTDGQVTLCVKDNGTGMSESVKGVAFEPFRQGETESHHKRQYGGVGLGLSIVQQLVSSLHGKVELESQLGVGTTMTVLFPAQVFTSEEASSSTARSDVESVDGSGSGSDGDGSEIRILMVDDVSTNRMILNHILNHFPGHTVHVVEAVNGKEAVSAVMEAGTPFDAIVMDVSMPIMDGLEATKLIRTLPQLQHIPIVGVSAAAVEKECLDAGMTAFIIKPHTAEEFYRVCGPLLAHAYAHG